MNVNRCECESPTIGTRHEGSSLVSYCIECGQPLLATTKLPDIDVDTTTYRIHLLAHDKPSVAQLKAVAKVANINLLQAKELAAGPNDATAPMLIFEGRAANVQRHRRDLIEAEVEFTISPEFPYDESAETNTIVFD